MRRRLLAAVCAAAGAIVLAGLLPGLAAGPRQGTAAAQQPGPPPDALEPGEFQWFPERSPAGPAVVLVSLPDQLAHVYRNGVRIGVSTVSTGKPGYETPTGVFRILEKKRQHRSNLYDDAPMPYMTRLTWTGVALHAGHLPGYPASHGCVRMPLEFARLLYEVTTLGATVIIADSTTLPDTVLRAAQVFDPSILEEGDGGHSAAADARRPFTWRPELAPEGPVSLLLSTADRRAYVYRNGVEIGRSEVTLRAPGPLGDGVFTLLDGNGEGTATTGSLVPGRPARRWMAVDMPGGGERVDLEELQRRVRIPPEFARRVYDLISPGTTLVVTDLPAGDGRRSQPGLVVLAGDDGEDGESDGPGGATNTGRGGREGHGQGGELLSALRRTAPKLDPEVLGLALEAADCARRRGVEVRRPVLAVIDYSLPSTLPRLWIFDLEHRRLLHRELVAHGEGSGANFARAFSNREGSHQSSLGLFLTAGTYHGRNGYSLRLIGLEQGINDLALARTIVMHGAWYVSRDFAAEHGRLGRSWGCPAVRRGAAREVIDAVKGGSLLFVYHPDRRWLSTSPFLAACAEPGVATAAAR